MSAIAKADGATPDDAWVGLWRQVAAHMHACNAHAARTVVLLPFFQLQSVARASAAKFWGGGFLPRIETTKSWQQRVAPFSPDALDLSFDAGLDALRARVWLSRSGLQDHQAVLAPLLVEAAQQLGALAAAMPPEQRGAWLARMRPVVGAGFTQVQAGLGTEQNTVQHDFAAYETAVGRIALEWAAASSYASDALFEQVLHEVDACVVLRGVQRNPLSLRLAEHFEQHASGKTLFVDLPSFAEGELHVHAASGAEDEAQRAAACVMAHVARGAVPVALPAMDRVLTRRISALLSSQGLVLSDETGWKLSTTRAAAQLMSLLRAAHPLATQDEHLDWLKHSSAAPAAVQRLEQALRKQNTDSSLIESARSAIVFVVNEQPLAPQNLLQSLQAPRPVSDWLTALALALQRSGQWAALQADAAGQQVLQALHLDMGMASQDSAAIEIIRSDASRMSLPEFSAWVQTALEGASFKPPSRAEQAQVLILPLAQLAARPFAALVLAGCDEGHLPAAPQWQGIWSRAQREALGLPSRELLQEEQQTVWRRAMQFAHVDVLWRSAEGEEALSRSPLLQAWQLQHGWKQGVDQRQTQAVLPQPVLQPAPSGALLAGSLKFSASSYQDVRTCPYRFFALRLLRLQEAQELDTELSKRDFGSWLHEVLSQFHRSRTRETNPQQDTDLLDACAAQVAQAWFGQDAGFIPFAAAWPQVRQSYLLWLAQHEEALWRFESSELEAQAEVGDVLIQGRLDRVDVRAGSGASEHMVIDYKTENASSLAARVSRPLEDTQLVFYAALLGKSHPRAAYLGLYEKEVKEVEQSAVNDALPLLLAGLADDAQRIAAGHRLPALGEGAACDYCAARGLCRKDSWASTAGPST